MLATDLLETALTHTPYSFGCAPLGNLYQAISDDNAHETLTRAWNAGMRLFDTAPHYGQGLSERRLGDFLRHRQKDSYVLFTKAGRLLKPALPQASCYGFVDPLPFSTQFDYSYDGIMRSFDDSLQRLGLHQIDCLLMHDIAPDVHGENYAFHHGSAVSGGYRAMAELKRSGQVQAIGLGLNDWQVCDDAFEWGDWDLFLLAGQYSLLNHHHVLGSFFPKCLARNCPIILGGVFNSGILATGVRSTASPKFNYRSAPEDIRARVEELEIICEEFGVSLISAALQFPSAHPAIASTLISAGLPEEISNTLAASQAEIPNSFWYELKLRGLIHVDAPIPIN